MKDKNWLDKKEYPFDIKTAKIGSHKMSYIDEGEGDAILFVHGTPSWSFEYRKVILKLKEHYRCIAPDHLGFGLSDQPERVDYRPQAHAERLKELIETLSLKKFHLVVHDFGGPIGLSVALDHPEKIKSLNIINTWLWPLNEYEHFTKPMKLISSFVGKFLYEKMNFSANILLKTGFHDQKLLTENIHNQYKKAQTKAGRKAAYVFARSLLGESEWYEKLWKSRHKIQKITTRIIWGTEDQLLPAKLLLPKWRSGFPDAAIHEVAGAGHFVCEEKPDEIVEILSCK